MSGDQRAPSTPTGHSARHHGREAFSCSPRAPHTHSRACTHAHTHPTLSLCPAPSLSRKSPSHLGPRGPDAVSVQSCVCADPAHSGAHPRGAEPDGSRAPCASAAAGARGSLALGVGTHCTCGGGAMVLGDGPSSRQPFSGVVRRFPGASVSVGG